MKNLPLTIFTTCKEFVNETELFQSLAIQSWRALNIDVIIIGDEDGTSRIAKKLNCEHHMKVERSHENIPLVNDLFKIALEQSTSAYLCYLNADIILDEHFLTAFNLFVKHDFDEPFRFLTARRKTIPYVNVNSELRSAKTQLDYLNEKYSVLDPPDAIDMFLFSRELYQKIPSFEIGRMRWDNWLLKHAKDNNAAVLDGTNIFTLTHPIHGYDIGLNNILTGTANQTNIEKSQGSGCDIKQARNYIFNGNNIVSHSSSDNDVSFFYDRNAALKSFLFYLKHSISSKSNLQIWDAIRHFLWKSRYYFPFNATPCDMTGFKDDILNNVITFNNKTIEDLYYLLQSQVSEALLTQLKLLILKSTPIVVWGVGSFSFRLCKWLERNNIQVSYYVDSFSELPSIHGNKIFRPEQLTLEPTKPFVLIGSSFVNEIKINLDKLKYKEINNYNY